MSARYPTRAMWHAAASLSRMSPTECAQVIAQVASAQALRVNDPRWEQVRDVSREITRGRGNSRPRSGIAGATATARPEFSQIVEAAAAAYCVSPKEVLSRGRPRAVAWARQLAMVLHCEIHRCSPAQIGREFDRDDGTVAFAFRAVKDRWETSPEDRRLISEAREALGLAPWSEPPKCIGAAVPRPTPQPATR